MVQYVVGQETKTTRIIRTEEKLGLNFSSKLRTKQEQCEAQISRKIRTVWLKQIFLVLIKKNCSYLKSKKMRNETFFLQTFLCIQYI